MSLNEYYANVPGVAETLNTVEGTPWWGPKVHQLLVPRIIDSATVDAGHSDRTTLLRPGLILGEVTSTKRLVPWNPLGTNGSQRIYGILPTAMDMLVNGTATHKMWQVLVKGNLKAKSLVVPGEAAVGLNGTELELRARAQLAGRFLLDDEPWNINPSGGGGWIPRNLLAADLTAGAITLTEADNRTWFFTTTGAHTTIHLPAITADERYGFHIRVTNTQDFNLIIDTAAGDEIIGFNDVDLDSVALQTAGDLIGGTFEIYGFHNGTVGKYVILPILWGSDGVLVQTATLTD